MPTTTGCTRNGFVVGEGVMRISPVECESSILSTSPASRKLRRCRRRLIASRNHGPFRGRKGRQTGRKGQARGDPIGTELRWDGEEATLGAANLRADADPVLGDNALRPRHRLAGVVRP